MKRNSRGMSDTVRSSKLKAARRDNTVPGDASTTRPLRRDHHPGGSAVHPGALQSYAGGGPPRGPASQGRGGAGQMRGRGKRRGTLTDTHKSLYDSWDEAFVPSWDTPTSARQGMVQAKSRAAYGRRMASPSPRRK